MLSCGVHGHRTRRTGNDVKVHPRGEEAEAEAEAERAGGRAGIRTTVLLAVSPRPGQSPGSWPAPLEKLSASRRSKCSPGRGGERLARRAVAQSPPSLLERVFVSRLAVFIASVPFDRRS